jgi:hypothetical protein
MALFPGEHNAFHSCGRVRQRAVRFGVGLHASVVGPIFRLGRGVRRVIGRLLSSTMVVRARGCSWAGCYGVRLSFGRVLGSGFGYPLDLGLGLGVGPTLSLPKEIRDCYCLGLGLSSY